MSLYLIVNLAIIAIPLALSFEKNLKFYRLWPAVGFSMLVVSTAYIVWDVIATARGDWMFNPEYVGGIEIFNLPLEEILFFITVPYACIFIYETVHLYLQEKTAPRAYLYLLPLSVLLFAGSWYYSGQYYTATVFSYTAVFFILSAVLIPSLTGSRNFWISMAVTYVPFFIVNYILTSTPVVIYNDAANWSVRVTTIPLEDFFYSFSMISLWFLFYEVGLKIFKLKPKREL